MMTLAYLSRGSGPVRESDDPFDPACDSVFCPDCDPAFLAEDIITFPARSNPLDSDYLKQAILDYGGLYASMYWDEAYLRTENGYYCPDLNTINHAVVLVGWDDGLTVAGAPGPGAFIARNSRGPGFGEEGYFYISFFDPNLASIRPVCFEDRSDGSFDYDRILYYDDLGPTGLAGYPGENRAWGGNTFYPTSDGYLTAVGLFVPRAGMTCRIHIYDGDLIVPFGNLLYSFTVAKPYGGWYVLELETPIRFRKSRILGLAVEYESPVAGYTVPVEHRVSGWSSRAESSPGQSYISRDGILWTDLALGDWCDECNISLKAFVRNN